MGTGGVEHGAPGGGGCLDAKAEEAERGFGKNGGGHAHGGLDEHGLQGVGQDRAREQAKVGGAERAGGLDELAFAHGGDLRADQARVADPGGQGQREDEVGHGGAEEGDHGYGEQDPGQGQEGVAKIDREHRINPAAVEAGERTEEEAESEREQDDSGGNGEGDPGAEEDTGENVAAEFIGAEEVMRGRRREAMQEVDAGRVVRGKPGGKDGKEHEDRDEEAASGDGGVRSQQPERTSPHAPQCTWGDLGLFGWVRGIEGRGGDRGNDHRAAGYTTKVARLTGKWKGVFLFGLIRLRVGLDRDTFTVVKVEGQAGQRGRSRWQR